MADLPSAPDLHLCSMAEAGRRFGVAPQTAEKVLREAGLRFMTSGDRRYVFRADVELLARAQLLASALGREADR